MDPMADFDARLVRKLVAERRETETVEFKANDDDADKIGKYISAMSNSAALIGEENAYVIWGVHNKTFEILGTDIDPSRIERQNGNEELESWLRRQLAPQVPFVFREAEVDGRRVVLLEIGAACNKPTEFALHRYIRIGSTTKLLRLYPDIESELWDRLKNRPFEMRDALECASSEAVVALLDCQAYFTLSGSSLPDGHEAIVRALAPDNLVTQNAAGGWTITNLGALLFAKDLTMFPTVARKGTRLVQYAGSGRDSERKVDRIGQRGYASGLNNLIGLVMALLPSDEVQERATKRLVPRFPQQAVRELVANALIHQNLFASGEAPEIVVFSDRVEISNPGSPLVPVTRFLDQCKSRNSVLASTMRNLKLCERLGSGIDKVMKEAEIFQLPPPRFEASPIRTTATLFEPRAFTEMSEDERQWACFWHVCFQWVQKSLATNATLRERFRLPKTSKSTVSRLLTATKEAGWIRLADADAAMSDYSYVPWFAQTENLLPDQRDGPPPELSPPT